MSRWTIPFCVGCIERVRNLDSERQNQLRLHRSPCDAVRFSVMPSRNSMAMKASPCWSSIS